MFSVLLIMQAWNALPVDIQNIIVYRFHLAHNCELLKDTCTVWSNSSIECTVPCNTRHS